MQLGYGLGVWLALHLLVVLYQEHSLAKALGDSFLRCREQGPGWIPRVHPPAP